MNCATTTHCALVLFAILSGAPNALASYCPNGWTHGNLNYPTALDKTRGNFCYKFFDSSKFWVDAEAMCVSESAHLMSIHSADEQVIATGLCGSTQQSRCWIGFNDKQAGTNCEGLNGCVANYNTNGPWYGSDGSLGNGNPNYSGSQWIDNDNDPNNAAGHSPCSGQACAARNFGYEDWSGSGEPNNYNNGGAGSWKGEHCSECWGRCTSWNDMPCQGAVYSKFACKKPANVFPGYYSTSGSPAVGDFGKYFDMRPCPAGRYNAGITDPRNGQYGVGVCSLCPAGTFAVGVADPDGTVSNPGAASSACGGNCAPGFYCTAGSTRNDPPAGRCPGTPFICRHLDYCCFLYFLLVLIFFFPLQLAVTGQGVPPIIFAVASAMQDVTVSQDPIKPVRQNVPPVRTETVAAPMLHATVIVRPVIIAHKKQVLPLKSNAVGINIIAPAVLNPPLMYPRGIMPPVAVHKRGPALKFVQRGLTVPVVS